jgi:hypothetical protein
MGRLSAFPLFKKLFRLFRHFHDFAAVVVAAGLAHSVGQNRLSAIRALDQSRKVELPMGAAALILFL